MKRRIQFIPRVINSLPPCPPDHGGREVEYTSAEAPPGLRLVVSKRGLKSWLYRYTMPSLPGPGIKRAIKIGVYPGMEPAQAVRLAYDLRAQVSQGIDPHEVRQEKAEVDLAPTIDEFFEGEYLATCQTLRSLDDIKSRWIHHIRPVFGKQRFHELKTADIVRFHNTKRIEMCAATANRLLALLKRVINVAIMLEHCERNPCRGVRMHPEQNIRQRTLSGEELKRFIWSISQEPSRVAADFFLFALATGARREECLKSTRSEFVLEERVWRLPASRAKSGKSRAIPLNDVALEVVVRRLEASKGPFVFPGRDGKPLSNPTKAWKRCLQRAGIEDLKMHDLRRSAATLLLNHGGSMTQASNLLGHASTTMTATRYAFLADEQLVLASRKLGDVISAAQQPASTPTSA